MKPDFAVLMAFEQHPPRPAAHGIFADWTRLPAATKPFRARWKHWNDTTSPLPTAGGGAEWIYSSKTVERDHLMVRVEIYQGGQKEAIERMNAVGHSSNALSNPFGPAPESMRLGDYTAMLFPERISDQSPVQDVFWVYYNAFARVRLSAIETTFDVMPMARAIQAFMKEQVVTDLPNHCPAVLAIEAPAKPVHVGETFSVKLVVKPGIDFAGWFVEIDHPGDLLSDLSSADPLVGLFEAEGTGHAALQAFVLDKKSLLSKRLEAAIEVLPARPSE
jgi:hypothetical protein